MDIWGRAFQANAESSAVLAMSWGHGGQNAGPRVAGEAEVGKCTGERKQGDGEEPQEGLEQKGGVT